MAWRVLEIGDVVWYVSLAAERLANSDKWGLLLSFRARGRTMRPLWVPYPIQSSSKASLYAQSEQLTDQELAQVLAAHLS